MKLAFKREHLAELRALGLLSQEVESLQRALPALAELLLPPVAMDARRDVLKNLHAALSTAASLVAKIEAAPAPDVGLGRTAYETVWRSLALELAPASEDGGPLFPHLEAYRATVERALDALPARAVSSGSAIAITVLVDALEAGRDAARNDGERPSGFLLAVTPGSPFERMASACYAAVGGGSPLRDLRRYRKSLPLRG